MLNQQHPNSNPSNPIQPIVISQHTKDNNQQAASQLKKQISNNAQFEYQYEHIADRLLRELEEDYLQVHKYQMSNFSANQPGKNKNIQELLKNQQQDNEDAQPPEGYENMENDNYSDNNLNSSSHSHQYKQQADQQNQYGQIQDFTNLHKQEADIGEQKVELIEVGPVPDSVFSIPKPSDKEDSLDYEKIKNFALTFDIQPPSWANDPKEVQMKIRKLFGNNDSTDIKIQKVAQPKSK